MSLLNVNDVSREFGGVHAISGVSLEVSGGEIYGLIGPNGAGKTTLFNTITGIYPATSGHVVFDGVDITNRSPAEVARSGISRTFQAIHIFAGMSVLDNVLMGQSRRAPAGLRSLLPIVAERRERKLAREAEAALDLLGIRGFAGSSPRDLPHAIRRKVEMARAIAAQPKVLLLDEPAAGLNEDESLDLSADIRAIRDQGTTIVLIEHDMSVVMDVCDRLAVLNFGEKIAEGQPLDIQKNPQVIEAYLGAEQHDLVA